jgi:hypothetical protein
VQEPTGEWIDEPEPAEHYNSSSIRQTWKSIRSALERNKVKVSPIELQSQTDSNGFQITPIASSEQSSTPVLIPYTFHPKWVRLDNQPLYAATPFFTVGFFDKGTHISFQRTKYDRLAVWCSLCALALLAGLSVANLFSRRSLSKTKGTYGTLLR